MFTWLLRSKFESFRSFTNPLEAQILSGFFISLGVNGLILLLLDSLSLVFSLAKWPLLLIAGGLACCVYLFVIRLKAYQALRFEVSIARLGLYLFVFAVLFYNGGLIEKMTDSWWHMSLANKISLESTFNPQIGHLVGLPTRYYPPLCHGNIALAQQLSGISIPVYWNSLTAWVGMFKVMAFYLFAFGLGKNRQLALLAAILFVLLPGVGASFLRVSAWPSHVAYTAWYAMFYLFALIFDDLPESDKSLRHAVLPFLSDNASKLIGLTVLSVLVLFTHKAEILWFAVAWFAYLIAASFSRSLSKEAKYIAERDHYFLRYFYRGALLVTAAYALWFAANEYPSTGLDDQVLAYLLPVALLSLLFLLDMPFKSKSVMTILMFVFLGLLLAAVNYTHLYSLFMPELALPAGASYESPAVATGYLGGELKAPSWHLQLRSGLLYTGVLSVPIAIAALAIKPTRLSIFVAGTSCLALLFCISPYLYHWLQALLNYHSPWRISLIIVHPITWALVLVTLNDVRKGSAWVRV
jgi:hypothetical protein